MVTSAFAVSFSETRYNGRIPDLVDFKSFLNKQYVFKKAAKAQRKAALEARRVRAQMTELEKLRADNEGEIERADRAEKEKNEKEVKAKGRKINKIKINQPS